ncbi:A/G-specific adenine glycosylase [Sulfobacillus harzensis]|uniref:Adenine DNA glycosylase n=1 Tax=Sulfobacillus harzensis TaxID=2729629 RepID=A0A7Y0L3X7_9FIRM|nr:A/G-specific adenine glycosylase [Sulfobacillus harzensis]NMP22477.1 A/G-specific adenine glycosylase [Sulfobacillus harzensis]
MKRVKYRAAVDDDPLEGFREAVLGWYDQHGRNLPWRRTRDPYAIIVSEIMLHQTTVATVAPVYEEFMQRFPTVQALHEAALEEVKAITDPLGYKVRGRWLKDIARAVVEERGGIWPDSVEELMTLPGVGRYTAGAVASFALGIDAPILDTNVKRVLGRYFGIDYKNSRAETQHVLWALAEAVVPEGQASRFNQALMDFGAMLCTARKPLCLLCPARVHCQSGGVEAGQAAEAPFTYRLLPRDEESSDSAS